MAVNRTTAADFSYFKLEALKCVARWKIAGWRVEFRHEKLEGKAAQCATMVEACAAWISLAKNWHDEPVTKERLRDVARHEVTHLLLAPLVDVMAKRYLTAEEDKQAGEFLCRRLQDLLP